ncbi:NAD(P)-dependent oxidoreductase [Baekduia soli]|uniref:NAD(P)-dependent oxidoreductase n=1 Tax=Baekduia soli TaxID=496014 RepID=A0A5B8U9A7_9ACTN|nr:NAD(P)-dependent oxidoreductase [Baekduia soli]QEC49726.1 NAD(P)-dependent oxidoreductase [Baekduia soli]
MSPAGPVLITGGSGFTGVHLARMLLDAGRPVRLLDVAVPAAERRFVLGADADALTEDMITASVDDWSAVLDAVRTTRPSAIVHIAAVVSPEVLARRPNLALQVNLGGTVNVLEGARMFDVARTVVFSSIGVLPTRQYEPIDVAHPLLLAGEGPNTGSMARRRSAPRPSATPTCSASGSTCGSCARRRSTAWA